MDWSNESYVRVYTRDTGDLLAVGWEGRAVLWELMRKADLAGVVDHGGDVEIVAEMLRMPHDVVTRGMDRLARRAVILLRPNSIVIRNYRPAQEAVKSDKQRQKESRSARLARALADGTDPATAKAIARPDRYAPPAPPDDGSQNVTISGHENGPNGHDGSHGVTMGHDGSLGTLRCGTDTDAMRCDTGGVGGLAAGPPAPPAKSKRTKPKLSEPTPEEWRIIEVVLARLTEYSSVTWTARNPRGGTTEHAEIVLARMRAGASERDLRVVVWHRGHEWQDNPEMSQYLRPSTLFARRKFAEYLPQALSARETYERDEATRGAARQREAARPVDSNGAFLGLMSIAGGLPK